MTLLRLPLLALFVAVAIAGARPLAQGQSARTGTLVVAGDVSTPLTLKADDLRAFPRTTVSMQEDGRTVRYEGVLLAEVLKKAGVPLGRDLRGDAVATYVLATANDGYKAVYSLAEVDPEFTSNDVIVADSADGKPLFDYQGPLRLVAPKDARAARSVRMLERIDVVRVRK